MLHMEKTSEKKKRPAGTMRKIQQPARGAAANRPDSRAVFRPLGPDRREEKMKAGTGSSLSADARQAGREAARKAADGLERVKLVFAYASSRYYNKLSDLAAGIRDVLPQAQVIGGTSWRGVVLPEGLVEGEYFVGALALSDENLSVGVGTAENNDDDPVGAGRAAALAALARAGRREPPDYFYMAAMPGFEEFYLQGIREVIGDCPMFGQSVVDNQVTGDWDIFTQEGVVGYGLAVAFFYNTRSITNHFTAAPYYEGEERFHITKIDKSRRLEEVEGPSLVERIVRRTGIDPDFLSEADIQMSTILEPLGVRDHPEGPLTLRFPMCLYRDGSIAMGCNVSQGSLAVCMKAETEDLVAASAGELEKLAGEMERPPAAYHLAMGYGRSMIMHAEEKLSEAVTLIRKAAGDVPFIMPFTLSECGLDVSGREACANLMLSYTGLAE